MRTQVDDQETELRYTVMARRTRMPRTSPPATVGYCPPRPGLWPAPWHVLSRSAEHTIQRRRSKHGETAVTHLAMHERMALRCIPAATPSRQLRCCSP
jgi:hypothetical protein